MDCTKLEEHNKIKDLIKVCKECKFTFDVANRRVTQTAKNNINLELIEAIAHTIHAEATGNLPSADHKQAVAEAVAFFGQAGVDVIIHATPSLRDIRTYCTWNAAVSSLIQAATALSNSLIIDEVKEAVANNNTLRFRYTSGMWVETVTTDNVPDDDNVDVTRNATKEETLCHDGVAHIQYGTIETERANELSHQNMLKYMRSATVLLLEPGAITFSVQRGSLAEPQTLDLIAAGINTTSSLQ